MAQYGRRNNVILSGIPESVSEDVLEESVISVLADIDVLVESQDVEACHRFDKPDRDKSQKIIVRFVNRKNCKKFYLTRKNLAVLITANTIFTQNTKSFANQNLTTMNESICYNCRKLKRSGLINGCFSRDGIVRIKRRKDRPGFFSGKLTATVF